MVLVRLLRPAAWVTPPSVVSVSTGTAPVSAVRLPGIRRVRWATTAERFRYGAFAHSPETRHPEGADVWSKLEVRYWLWKARIAASCAGAPSSESSQELPDASSSTSWAASVSPGWAVTARVRKGWRWYASGRCRPTRSKNRRVDRARSRAPRVVSFRGRPCSGEGRRSRWRVGTCSVGMLSSTRPATGPVPVRAGSADGVVPVVLVPVPVSEPVSVPVPGAAVGAIRSVCGSRKTNGWVPSRFRNRMPRSMLRNRQNPPRRAVRVRS